MTPPRLDPYDILTDVRHNIALHGWNTIEVGPQPNKTPGWVYTQGMKTHQHPDLIMFGLVPSLALPLLAAMYQRICQGQEYTPGQVYTPVPNVPVIPVRVDPSWLWSYCVVTLALYGCLHEPSEAPFLQLVYPDRNGYWPGDTRCNAAVQRLPRLGWSVDEVMSIKKGPPSA
jgi:hypothetical protein